LKDPAEKKQTGFDVLADVVKDMLHAAAVGEAQLQKFI
jgi:hypothetical protein